MEAKTAENLCLGSGCRGKGFFAKVSRGVFALRFGQLGNGRPSAAHGVVNSFVGFVHCGIHYLLLVSRIVAKPKNQMPYSTVHSIKICTAMLVHGKEPRIILNTINMVNVKNYSPYRQRLPENLPSIF